MTCISAINPNQSQNNIKAINLHHHLMVATQKFNEIQSTSCSCKKFKYTMNKVQQNVIQSNKRTKKP